MWVRVELGSVRGLRECVETSPASLNSEDGEGPSQHPLHAWETWITALPPGQHSPIWGEEQGEGIRTAFSQGPLGSPAVWAGGTDGVVGGGRWAGSTTSVSGEKTPAPAPACMPGGAIPGSGSPSPACSQCPQLYRRMIGGHPARLGAGWEEMLKAPAEQPGLSLRPSHPWQP